MVKHLTISDGNYHLAIQMLKQEYLNVNYIIDETYKNILKAAPIADCYPEYTSSKMYLNEMRSYSSSSALLIPFHMGSLFMVSLLHLVLSCM